MTACIGNYSEWGLLASCSSWSGSMGQAACPNSKMESNRGGHLYTHASAHTTHISLKIGGLVAHVYNLGIQEEKAGGLP